jgi:hypothetical protein
MLSLALGAEKAILSGDFCSFEHSLIAQQLRGIMTDGPKQEPNHVANTQHSMAGVSGNVDLTKDDIVRLGLEDSKILLAIERGEQSFVCGDEGLHMRPSDQIVRLANELLGRGLQLSVGAPTIGVDNVDLRSILSIMMGLAEASLAKEPIQVRIATREGVEQPDKESFKEAWRRVFEFDFWEPVNS